MEIEILCCESTNGHIIEWLRAYYRPMHTLEGSRYILTSGLWCGLYLDISARSYWFNLGPRARWLDTTCRWWFGSVSGSTLYSARQHLSRSLGSMEEWGGDNYRRRCCWPLTRCLCVVLISVIRSIGGLTIILRRGSNLERGNKTHDLLIWSCWIV